MRTPEDERTAGAGRGLQPGAARATAPGGHRDPAARRGARARGAARAGARRRRASWAACGCSPAAPSTPRRATATRPTARLRSASCRRRPPSALAGPGRAREVLALDHPGAGADPLRHALLPGGAARGAGAADRRRGVRGPRLVHAAGRPGGPRRAASSCSSSPRSSTSSSCRSSPPWRTLLAHARGQTVEPVEPRVVLEGEVARILLPGDPGY